MEAEMAKMRAEIVAARADNVGRQAHYSAYVHFSKMDLDSDSDHEVHMVNSN